MIIFELSRHLKNKTTWVLIGILLSIVGLSYYNTYLEKMEWLSTLNNAAPDLDIGKVKAIIHSYTGLYYFERFLFTNEYFSIASIFIAIGIGMITGSTAIDHLQTSWGTFINSRMKYSNYLLKLLFSNVIFVIIIVFTIFLLIAIVSVLVLGGHLSVPSRTLMGNISAEDYCWMLFFKFTQLVLYLSVITSVPFVIPLFVRNRYLTQFVPFVIIVLTYIIGNGLGNVYINSVNIGAMIYPDSILGTFSQLFISDQSLWKTILYAFSFILFGTTFFVCLSWISVRKFSKDYIL